MNTRGYPLGALFVAVTACAVIVAGVAPLIRSLTQGELSIDRFGYAMAAGVVFGLVIGVVVGLCQVRKPLGVALGAGAGTLIGAAAGIIALLSAQQLGPATTAMTAGSALIVAVALVMRRKEL